TEQTQSEKRSSAVPSIPSGPGVTHIDKQPVHWHLAGSAAVQFVGSSMAQVKDPPPVPPAPAKPPTPTEEDEGEPAADDDACERVLERLELLTLPVISPPAPPKPPEPPVLASVTEHPA